MKIGIIGAGKLTKGIVNGWINSGAIAKKDLWAVTKTSKSAAKVRSELNIKCSNKISPTLLKNSDVILLGVKPYHLNEITKELESAGLKSSTLVFSVLAGVSTTKLQNALGQKNPVIITMTNTPCMLQAGMTTLYKGKHAKTTHIKLAKKLFSKVGHVLEVPEKFFHEVTAISGSGPAFVYYLMKLISEAATKMGLPKKSSQELCAQTFLGAAKMLLETGNDIDTLISNVTTPGGCTIEGVKVLKKAKLAPTFDKTLRETRNKSKKLG